MTFFNADIIAQAHILSQASGRSIFDFLTGIYVSYLQPVCAETNMIKSTWHSFRLIEIVCCCYPGHNLTGPLHMGLPHYALPSL